MKRPAFHCAPKTGWVNDPNAPILIKDNYHLFYQHVPDSSEWQWGLVWGHMKSKDLVQWEHLPVALAPTADGLDRHGCFSGCAAVDEDGRPSLLYTGVIRKSAEEMEPGLSHQHEAQMIAVAADPDDPNLERWLKLPGSFLPSPSPDLNLTGWRDPFVLQQPGPDSDWWYVMVGAGVRDSCGTALVYRSRQLTSGWECMGRLCESSTSHMWECPIMALVSNTPPMQHASLRDHHHHHHHSNGGSDFPLKQRHMFCVSPDYCVNMARYWLGHYEEGRFDLQGADGPHLLDLGDILYAPNLLKDKQGRTVLWAWMQEKRSRPPGTYDSACCLCVPRVLSLSPDGSTLLQEPLPELNLLRQHEKAWHAGEAAGPAAPLLLLPPGMVLQLGGSSGSHMDIELSIARGSADAVVLVLQPFDSGVEGAAGAGIAYCWETNTLQVIHSTDMLTLEHLSVTPIEPPAIKKLPAPEPEEVERAAAQEAADGKPARCGGKLRSIATGSSEDGAGVGGIKLRVLLDGSCLEVFTSTGEALGTRVYRGDEPPLDHGSNFNRVGWEREDGVAGVEGEMQGGQLQLVSFGGSAQLATDAVASCSAEYVLGEMSGLPPLTPTGTTAVSVKAT
eukprot:gene13159-13289_t